MGLTVRPKELATLLAQTIPAGEAVLVTGAPGIGKTDIVTAAAAAADADMLTSHPVVEDPTVPAGLPWPDATNGHARFLPFGIMAKAIAATRRTVWFLDDLGQAAPAVQAAYMQLLLARRVGEHVVPDHITFVAATNRRTDRAGVTGILEPVKSRFATIVELQPNVDDWCQWAFGHHVPAELIAFLRFKTELLCAFTPTADLTNCPVPRTWAHVGRLLALALPGPVLHAAIAGAVGEGAAVEFAAFRSLYAELPNIDAILLDPKKGRIPEKPAVLYSVATALGMRATQGNFGRIAQYAERLVEKGHGEFAALLVLDCCARDEKIYFTQAFSSLSSSGLGALISGGVQ